MDFKIKKRIHLSENYIKYFYILILTHFAIVLLIVILNINIDTITTISWPFVLLFLGYLCGVAEFIVGIVGIIKGIRNLHFIKALPNDYLPLKTKLKKLCVHLVLLSTAMIVIFSSINILH